MPKNSFAEEALNTSLIRQMPYSLEAEQAVLGALILDSSVVGDVSMILKTDDFYVDKHRTVYGACLELYLQSKTIDVVTLLAALVSTGIFNETGAKSYIMQLTELVPSLPNVRDYAKIVKDKSLLRQLITVTGEIADSCYLEEDEARRILDNAEAKIFSLTQGNITNDFVHINDAVLEYYNQLQLVLHDKDATLGTPTYFGELDRLIVGMKPGDFILIGARPGVGKTAFALNIAAPVAKKSGKSVAVFSLEMSRLQLVERLLSSEARIDSYKLKRGEISDEEFSRLAEAASVLSASSMYIDDTSGQTVSSMKAKLRRIKNLGLVVVDYLGLLSSDKKIDSRVNEVGDISRNLKIMAKELGVPVLCLAQLNRRSEEREKPSLSDLRESGAIEQDADVVMFLSKKDAADGAEQNTVDLVLAKNRHGSVGTITLGWEGQFTKFTSIEKTRDFAE